MKTTIKVSVFILFAIALSAKAQIKVKNSEPKPIAYVSHGGNMNSGHDNNSNPKNDPGNLSGQSNWQMNGGSNIYGSGNVSVTFGNYPHNGLGYGGPAYGYNSYNGNPNNGYNVKKAARYTLLASKSVIDQAIDLHNWNDFYSPMLAKAIRHHNYAKQMYYWGNYNAAINHAERAKYLAWCSLQYFQNPNYNNGYGEANYQDPYSDPNDPYYRKGNSDNRTMDGNSKHVAPETNEIDKKLPETGVGDKELIRSFDRSKNE